MTQSKYTDEDFFKKNYDFMVYTISRKSIPDPIGFEKLMEFFNGLSIEEKGEKKEKGLVHQHDGYDSKDDDSECYESNDEENFQIQRCEAQQSKKECKYNLPNDLEDLNLKKESREMVIHSDLMKLSLGSPKYINKLAEMVHEQWSEKQKMEKMYCNHIQHLRVRNKLLEKKVTAYELEFRSFEEQLKKAELVASASEFEKLKRNKLENIVCMLQDALKRTCEELETCQTNLEIAERQHVNAETKAYRFEMKSEQLENELVFANKVGSKQYILPTITIFSSL